MKMLLAPEEITKRYGWSRAEIAQLANKYGWSQSRSAANGWRVRYGARLVNLAAEAEDRPRLDGSLAEYDA